VNGEVQDRYSEAHSFVQAMQHTPADMLDAGEDAKKFKRMT
jgi:hypothetical protein